MKKLLIIIGLGIILIGMPAAVSDCGCNNSFVYQSTGEMIGDNAAAIYTIEDLCGLVVPENWWVDVQFDPCIPRGDLPESFDWRDIDGVDYTTSIKNQGNCGSCWAFGTVAPLECSIKIKDGIEVDLSEQWLVSCNRDDWGCGGGWFAHAYHKSKTDSCGGTGAVLEEYFPYVAYDVPCNCPYPHDYLIDRWAYISGYGVPSVDAMKQAIMDYGPISVAVCVNSAFHGYSGGVFSGPTCSNINHAVALVGWDDNQGSNGIWFLRNSWGPGWGEGGYMRIEYGVCDVGYAACYVDYPGVPKVPDLAVEEIDGYYGGFGKGGIVSAEIDNVGNGEATDVSWSISVKGGLFGLINVVSEGTMNALDAFNNKTVCTDIPIRGFGPVNIVVTTEASDVDKVTKTTNAVVWGVFITLATNSTAELTNFPLLFPFFFMI